MNSDSESRLGAAYAATAFFWWGTIPIYFRFVRHVSSPEIIAHRIVGVTILAFLILAGLRLLPEVRERVQG